MKSILNCCLQKEEESRNNMSGGNLKTTQKQSTGETNGINFSQALGSNHGLSTFHHQENLPRLPIPSLAETLSKFEDTVSPLLTKSQLMKTKSIVASFLKNEGPKLQSLLETYDKELAQNGRFGSYIEEFWNDAYLVPNDPVVLNINPYFLLEDDADANIAKNQILRASALTFQSLKFAASVKNGTLAPDTVKGTPLCMDQFKSLFAACRIPKDGKSDVIKVDHDSTTVAVMFRNQLYYFEALLQDPSDDEWKVLVNESDISHILQTIVNDGRKTSKAMSVKKAVGVLTTLPRDSWARARIKLSEMSERNIMNLSQIDSALFVLALDEFRPETVHEAAANMLHGTHHLVSSEDDDEDKSAFSTSYSILPSLAYQGGTCCNRYYDKLNIVVCEDGSAGINFEHSAIDGHSALRFVSDIFAETIVDFAKSVTRSIYRGGCPIPSIVHAKVLKASRINEGKLRTDKGYIETSPKKLIFDMDEEIEDQIRFAESKLGDVVKADDTYILEFKSFGKNLIVHNSLR